MGKPLIVLDAALDAAVDAMVVDLKARLAEQAELGRCGWDNYHELGVWGDRAERHAHRPGEEIDAIAYLTFCWHLDGRRSAAEEVPHG